MLGASLKHGETPDSKLSALLTLFRQSKFVGGFSKSRCGVSRSTAIVFTLITSIPFEYTIYINIPSDHQAEALYEQAKAAQKNIELLSVGNEAYFVPDATIDTVAVMQCQDMFVKLSKHKGKREWVAPELGLMPMILTWENVVAIFEDICRLFQSISD